MKPLFVTSNENKLREASNILGVELESASPDVDEIQALNLSEVAAAKAAAAREAVGSPPRPLIVEDSGLIIEAWNGLPGAFTKWFLSSISIEGLLRMLSGYEDRSARAVCVVAVADGSSAVHTFQGEVPGSVADQPRGESGFGWDPIFVPDGWKFTYAEMGEAKHGDSHRARAFRAARKWLERGA